MRKSYFTRGTSVLAVAALLGSTALPPPAKAVDPVTAVAATLAVAGQILALDAVPDPSAEQLAAILEHVRALQERLTQIEGGILATQEMIAQLPKRWRDDMEESANTFRREETRAVMDVVTEFVRSLRAAEAAHDRGQTVRFTARLEQAIVNFKMRARALLPRGGAVVPT